MKKTPMLITIPFVAVCIVIAIALLLKVFTPKPDVVVQKPTEFPNTLENTETSKPSTFLGGIFGQNEKKIAPTPSPASAAQFTSELKDTYDDGGTSELDSLAKEATSL